MLQYFVLLNKHRRLHLKRKSHYKMGLMIKIISLSLTVIMLFIFLSIDSDEEYIENISILVFPLLLMVDFSVRFFLKKNSSAQVLSYLCLPISRKALLMFIIFSEIQKIEIWGCMLIYSLIIYKSGNLTIINGIILFFLMLFNNYLVFLVYTITKRFAVLTFPFALACILFVLFLVEISAPVYGLVWSFCSMCMVATYLYFALREDLYKELDSVSF